MLDGARDAKKQMPALERRQHVQGRPGDLDGAHEQSEREMFAF